jgi:threonine aldolase
VEGSGTSLYAERMIDLRSDTLTQPTQGMRQAMAEAVCGDEQKREDPTVTALEERVAELLGQDEAVYLPTATMGNQIALRILSEPGDELIGTRDSHIFLHELGGPAVHSGLVMKPLPSVAGRFSSEDVRAAINPPGDLHAAPTRVVTLENTHNGAGGRVWALDDYRAVVAEARAQGLAVHLDGARLVNAAVAVGVSPAEWGREADTVTLCLSKGLGCPLGALIATSSEQAGKARRFKHLFGGAMRQAGIVAAAGIYALTHHVERLAEDHANARRLGEALADAGLPVDTARIETNFVQVDAGPAGLDAETLLARFRAEGVLLSFATAPGVLRAVTHLDVSAEDVEQAIPALVRAFEGSGVVGTEAAEAPNPY